MGEEKNYVYCGNHQIQMDHKQNLQGFTPAITTDILDREWTNSSVLIHKKREKKNENQS